MYKLIILIEPQIDLQAFERVWPEFLKRAEKMPGLLRETTSHVDRLLHGHFHVSMVHELYFESMQAALDAMASPEGEQAGKVLQTITTGKVTLLLADHLEDELANIRQHESKPEDNPADEDV